MAKAVVGAGYPRVPGDDGAVLGQGDQFQIDRRQGVRVVAAAFVRGAVQRTGSGPQQSGGEEGTGP
jgi:hypothetical protein